MRYSMSGAGAADAALADMARPPAVVVTAPAPVSVIAQASISGKPNRASNTSLMPRIDVRAETEAHAMPGLARLPSASCSRIAGITPR